ncbi:type II secretion system F family protein [Neptunomonas sp. XY-337]|uniref:type II secretion system F family protein n=1 Tax=Neptunomonas sp. XY-337 TaxID=2561897 RepID=UPI0010AAB964|nr:type II secretion system F family protein [Neptunomonas sp. XY-337]
MPDFYYKAVKRDGSIHEGTIAAESTEAAGRQLRAQGLSPVKLAAGQQAKVKSASTARTNLGASDVLSFTSELAVLLRAGLPIDRAMKVLIEMSAKPEQAAMLNDLLETVKGGKGLSQALTRYESVFGHFYINMVRSGEASGQLSSVLERLVEYLENAKAVRSSVVSALIYPAILLVVATLSILVMLGFVVPQFEALFADMGDALPLLTRWVIDSGNFIKAYGLALMAGAFVIGFLVRRWLGTPTGKAWKDAKLIKAPLIGGVLFKYEMAKFSRTMGTLLGNGVSLLQALGIANETVENERVRAALAELEPAVKRGDRMSQTLQASDFFTPMVIQIVRVGEESGRLDDMMLELAKVYDTEVQAGVKRGLTLLEPLLILLMGGSIAVIIIAILMGILSVNDLAI